jgi:hypothetical protein
MREDCLVRMEEYRVKSLEGSNISIMYDNYSGSLVLIKDIPKGGEILRSYGIPQVNFCYQICFRTFK